LYTVDAKHRVVSVARRVRVAWPQPLPGVPLQMFGAADQRLVVADPPALVTAAADQPPTSRPLPAGSDVAATRWGDLAAVAADGALLVRQGDDVVAYRPDSLAATGRVKGGGADLWMLTEWRPRGAYRGAFGDAGGQADQGAASDTAGPEGPMYVQVS